MCFRISIPICLIWLVFAGNVTGLADDKLDGPLIKNVKADEASNLLQENKKVVVLDVRTPEEFGEGHIAGAKNLDFLAPDFNKTLDSLDKSQTYLVHCAGGGRSSKARDLMAKHHFLTIYHLDGGFNAWKEAGKPVEK